MITAELSHRDHVGAYTIAKTFADLKFNGQEDVVKPLNRLAKLIEKKKYRKNQLKIEILTTAKENNYKEIEHLNAELKDLKNLRNRLIAMLSHENSHSRIKQVKAELEQLEETNYRIYCLIQKIRKLDNQWESSYSNYEELQAFRNLLAELGFVPTSSHATKSLQHEFFKYTGNEETLKQLAIIKLVDEEADLEKRCNNIRINFAKKLANNELPYANGILDDIVW